MKSRTIVVVVAIALVSLVSGWLSAQAYQLRSVTPVQPAVVMSGGDIGFRIEGRSGDVQVGTLVVKIDGRWMPTDAPSHPIQKVTH
jgi:hypothetical protein